MAKHKEIDFQKWEQLENYGEKMKAAVWAASQAVKRWLDLADELMDDAAADGSDMYCAACVVNENLQKMLEKLGIDCGEAPAPDTMPHSPSGLDCLEGQEYHDEYQHYQKAE